MKDEEHLNEETLNMYLDGELSAGKRDRVEAHLAACDECRAETAALQRLFAVLEELVPDLAPAVLARIRPRHHLSGPGLLNARSLWLIQALQAAAAVALLAWGWTRLAGYWTAARELFSPGTLADIWAELSGLMATQWIELSTWAMAQWATLPAWPEVREWAVQATAFSNRQFSLAQLAMLGMALAAFWVVGNAALLRRASLDMQK